MDNVKLPDIKRIKAVKQRLKKLPPQKSAIDTTNWENRSVSAVTFDSETQKKKVREVDFMMAEPLGPVGLTLAQVKQVLKDQGFTPEQIEQKIEESKNRNKVSK